jgi:hypothetical protein
MLIKIAEIRKAMEPSNDLPFFRGVPIFVPTSAARQSAIINISQDEIAKPFENKRAVKKNPTTIKLLPLSLNKPLCSSGLINFPRNLSVNFLTCKL